MSNGYEDGLMLTTTFKSLFGLLFKFHNILLDLPLACFVKAGNLKGHKEGNR